MPTNVSLQLLQQSQQAMEIEPNCRPQWLHGTTARPDPDNLPNFQKEKTEQSMRHFRTTAGFRTSILGGNNNSAGPTILWSTVEIKPNHIESNRCGRDHQEAHPAWQLHSKFCLRDAVLWLKSNGILKINLKNLSPKNANYSSEWAIQNRLWTSDRLQPTSDRLQARASQTKASALYETSTGIGPAPFSLAIDTPAECETHYLARIHTTQTLQVTTSATDSLKQTNSSTHLLKRWQR